MAQAAAGGGGMWHLRTFGGLAIEAVNRGAAPATRRRPLALLALLAIAGERGLSREKVVALLWPESDEERGRNSLSQALFTLRRDTDADDLVVGAGELRLNPSVISSDVAEFERCIASGPLERAVALYEGPFLDGVFVRDAAEFERWAEGHRRRVERAARWRRDVSVGGGGGGGGGGGRKRKCIGHRHSGSTASLMRRF